MLAGLRQIVCGLAMAVAGFMVVALAYSIWAAVFRADALILFGIKKPDWMFGPDGPIWWVYPFRYYYYKALAGVGVLMWLIGYAIRRVANSTSSILRR